MGMPGFDSVISSPAEFLFGMVTVPDTHLLQHLVATQLKTARQRLEGGVRTLARTFTPMTAMAA